MGVRGFWGFTTERRAHLRRSNLQSSTRMLHERSLFLLPEESKFGCAIALPSEHPNHAKQSQCTVPDPRSLSSSLRLLLQLRCLH